MKPRHLAKLLCSASILSMAATAAVAQSDDEGEADFLQLAPITITGEKQERSLQETASSVSVLTAEVGINSERFRIFLRRRVEI